jgi:hypothetical protein
MFVNYKVIAFKHKINNIRFLKCVKLINQFYKI